MHFGFMDVISLRSENRHVSAPQVAIFRAMRTILLTEILNYLLTHSMEQSPS